MTANPETRINEVKDFYYKLHSNQDSDWSQELCFDSVDENSIPRPGENSRTEREGKFSCAECYDALLKFQNG